MDWLDQLQPASWRGVPFHVDSIEVSAGDNVVLREYPFADLPTVFRMGTAAEEIKFSAYVIGPDYIDQREALREVLTGDGVLIHPTAGAIRCWANGKFTIREQPTAEGGMARFDLSFVRAEPRRYPQGEASTPDQAETAATEATEAADACFAAEWSVEGQTGWVADGALARLGAALDDLWGGLLPLLHQVTALPGGLDWSLGTMGQWQALQSQLQTLVGNPLGLAHAIGNLLGLPVDFADWQEDRADLRDAALNASQWAFALPSKPAPSTFETVRQPGADTLAMYGTGRSLAPLGASAAVGAGQAALLRLQSASDRLLATHGLAMAVRVSAASRWDDLDAARAWRAKLSANVTQLLRLASREGAGQGGAAALVQDWHAAMQRMLTAALADVAKRSQQAALNGAAAFDSLTLQRWTPVWALSYRLYGTTDRADELLALNPQIRHPLLVPPGVALRVRRAAAR